MRSAQEHLEQVLALVQPLEPQPVPLLDALGGVAAADIVAECQLPPFDNSAMDGYAVLAADVAGASAQDRVTLPVIGESAAGHPSPVPLAPGTAVRIMTGAPVPPGADAVVAQERVGTGSEGVTLDAPIQQGTNIRRAGEDAQPGDLLIPAGTVLRPRHLAAVASAGIATVLSRPAPTVAFVVTGDELVPPGEPLPPGRIHESNATTLAASLTALGAKPMDMGLIKDDAVAVRQAVTTAAEQGAHLIVTTGGASVGDHDPVKEALAGLGVEFLNVAIQPGKPQGLGVVDGVPVICLPGNPVAVAVCMELFVAPAVRALCGVPEPGWEAVVAGEDWSCPPGREQIMPVVFAEGQVRRATSGGSGSHLVARLAAADGLARVPAHVDAVRAGDTLTFRRFTA